MAFWNKKQKSVEPKVKLGLVAAFVVAMILNGLAGSTTILGGTNTGAVSDSFPNLFAPAGVTFAIWGVIYLLIAGFIVYTFGAGRAKHSALSTEKLSGLAKLLSLNLLLNAAWIVAWQYKVLWLSVLLIVALLITLAIAVNRLRTIELRGNEYVLAKLPFSVYFGWLTVATVANITTLLVSLGWKGGPLSEGTWMVAIVIIAAAIGIVTAIRNRDAAYLAVFVWAFAGILLKHLSPEGFDGKYPSTVIALTILLALFLSVIVQLVGQRFSGRASQAA